MRYAEMGIWRRSGLLTLAAVSILALGPSASSAQLSRRSSGITVRGVAWNLGTDRDRLVWEKGDDYSHFDGDGLGGWISFIGRMHDQFLLEVSLGTVIGRVDEVKLGDRTDTTVEALVPLLLGGRVYPIPSNRGGQFLPYLSLGGGPYWALDIESSTSEARDEVSWDSRCHLGGYLGGGIDLMFTDWIGFNLDLKRHFADFDTRDQHSGFEYGFGLQFMWD